jgi:hypothetical protein
MLIANANALTASGMAAFVAAELKFAGFYDDEEAVRQVAAECLTPLLRSAMIAIELAGLCDQEKGGALHDIIMDYIAVPNVPPAHVVEPAARRVG